MVAILSFPLIMYAALDARYTLMLGASVPFVNYQTVGGYAFTTAFHVLCVGIVICGNATTDAYLLLLVLHTYVVHMCVDRAVEVLNGLLQQGGTNEEELKREVQHKMLDLLRAHHKYN